MVSPPLCVSVCVSVCLLSFCQFLVSAFVSLFSAPLSFSIPSLLFVLYFSIAPFLHSVSTFLWFLCLYPFFFLHLYAPQPYSSGSQCLYLTPPSYSIFSEILSLSSLCFLYSHRNLVAHFRCFRLSPSPPSTYSFRPPPPLPNPHPHYHHHHRSAFPCIPNCSLRQTAHICRVCKGSCEREHRVSLLL